MSHFAEIDDNNIVLRVLVVPDEQEHRGEEYLAKDVGLGGRWIQTSYNGNIRKWFAGIGDIYDPIRDAFIQPKPHNSWVLNEDTCLWQAPVPMPEGGNYIWDEETISWIIFKE